MATIFTGAQSNESLAGVTNSRLLSNNTEFRNNLAARNLYTPDTEYPLTNVDAVDRTVGAINSIIAGITPFKSFNLKNTVFGRLVTDPTPLTEVGLIMLGKQFTLNSMSHISQQTFPVIKVSNLFDGSKDTKLFTKKINYSITKKEEISNFQQFLDTVVYYYPTKNYPFTKDAINSDFIKNSGTGQLQFLYTAINNNIYKQNDSTLTEYGIITEKPIQPRSSLLSVQTKSFFNFHDGVSYPYLNYHPSATAAVDANLAMIRSYNETSTQQEYAPNSDYINDNFGTAVRREIDRNFNGDKANESDRLTFSDDININSWIDTNTEFKNGDYNNKIVWGRDGLTVSTEEKLAQLKGLSEPEVSKNNGNVQDLVNGYNIKAGLLEYTKNLMNATEGQLIDITRKAYTKGGDLIGFNGSGIWRAPSTSLPEFRGRKGVRQHTALDQYDRFAKAIRFNGNKVYTGNENSVIYNSVIPRIHPTIGKDGKPDNKNLMFSIENLAIYTRKDDASNLGFIDDEFGSQIPICEVGQFNGRIMWFPPYNMEINETATARFESTVMVGRNEPMYNYMNSERSATLSFTLLVDYPEQLKNFSDKSNQQKAISEFFAFGGDSYDQSKIPENPELEIKKRQDRIKEIQGDTETAEPTIFPATNIFAVFPNDVPTDPANKKTDSKYSNLANIFDVMYKDLHYEIIDGCESSDGTGFGLNKDIYYISGLTEISAGVFILNPLDAPSQYNNSGLTGQFGLPCKLNKTLKDFYGDEANRKLYDINIVGSASKLFTETNTLDVQAEETYNEELGLRRAVAVKNLINKRLQAIFGKDAEGLGIKITTSTKGSTNASQDGATINAIPEQDTKQERSATITINRNSVVPEPKIPQISEEERTEIIQIQTEIEAIQTEINRKKLLASGCIMNERTSTGSNGEGDTGILHGFQAISGNHYYPVFHTQTPEDFHKRLTFLQQCTRQGAAKKYTPVVDDSGQLRARNSVFGRQPICVLRIGDFFFTKVIIENVTVDYHDTTWDMNPEGFGMQPMIANVTLQMKIIGGQSLKGPIDALQNAASFNYYANSTYTKDGMYLLPSAMAEIQDSYNKGIDTANNKIIKEFNERNAETKKILNNK